MASAKNDLGCCRQTFNRVALKTACRRMLGMNYEVVGMPMVWDMVPFDVQLIGGMVLHDGKIAEMRTGEGKTLVSTLPAYLNALGGEGVHIVTVNDYLVKRDSEWMGAIYRFLGLTVGVILHELNDQERKKAYNCDITYGTNNEFGFDYLRDNMKFSIEDYVQRIPSLFVIRSRYRPAREIHL